MQLDQRPFKTQPISRPPPLHISQSSDVYPPPSIPVSSTSAIPISPSGQGNLNSNTNPVGSTNNVYTLALYKLVMTGLALGLDRLVCRNMALPFIALSGTDRLAPMDVRNRALDVSAGDNQWSKNVDRITRMWAIAFTGCMLVVPLSLALFQINGVGDNVYTRTTALSAFLTSCAGLVSSSWYIFNRSRLRTRGMKEEWTKASRSRGTRASIDFWVLLTAPISCLARSAVFCLATICIVVWMDTASGDSSAVGGKSGTSATMTAVFVTVLIIGETIQIFRGMGFLD
ncbi:hypothetical protein GALMADRAFT_137642 [Galerina marginata CBS 339.88]|uniref:Uncharacterized protein n=1 Tax=Galerina marginata (strain CBS 339.88) TaxID=685588 RepID=A0A067T5Z1_GALM3|nr:hypothetical protein GALMADRAFT_137642 [Galerina marginata CBS 339.88]